MTQNVQATGAAGTNETLVTKFPPIIPMVIIATTLVAMAQFGSTERLAAAFAWLIFVAVLLADGKEAFSKLSSRMAKPLGITSTNATGTSPAGNILP